MLSFYFPKIRAFPLIKALNTFIYSPWFMLLVALLMALSNVFSMEFFTFYAYVIFGVYICLFADDCFPITTMFCCGYMLFSERNNPAANYGQTIFESKANQIQLIILVAVIVVMLTTRFLFEVIAVKRQRKRVPALTFGFIALGAAYLLSGLFTSGYGGRELAYAALQIVSLCLTYFFFYYTVDWGKRGLGDCAAMLSAIGVGLFIEIVGMYLNPRVLELIETNKFNRWDLLSGWGVYNNVGSMMAMLMPAPFYFACTKKHGWAYFLLAVLFLAGVFLTQSRGAILTACGIFGLCCIFAILYTPKAKRRFYFIVLFSVAGILLLVGSYVLLTVDLTVFESLLSAGSSDSGRFDIYKYGLNQFLQAPIFGKGFYAPLEDKHLFEIYQHGQNAIGENFFIPPRYHNTIVQLLATGGIVAMAAYIYHRFQTVRLFLKNPAKHKTFLAMSVLALLLSSMLDCHFFNLGPGLTYGIILLCAEMLPYPKKEGTPLRRKLNLFKRAE